MERASQLIAMTAAALLALQLPSVEMLVISVFAASLPVAFFVWLNSWLSSVKDENPEDMIAAQAKADAEHREHHGHGHGHGHHGKDHGHHHAHA